MSSVQMAQSAMIAQAAEARSNAGMSMLKQAHAQEQGLVAMLEQSVETVKAARPDTSAGLLDKSV